MIIRDIVNRDIINLTNCEHEPIHIPGSIQPHGFLVAFKVEDGVIDFCSGNIHHFLPLTHEQVLSKTMSQVFGHELKERITDIITRGKENFPMPLQITLNGRVYSVTTHPSGHLHIVEFEPGSVQAPDTASFYNQTRKFASYMEKATSLQELCQRVAEETRAITGYDRVMIYRFDKNYNGEVYGESRRDDIEPFLGLHYPHTDIPVQARELYKQNLLRLIVDINYTPVPLYTVDDQSGKNLNLGHAALRSVSPIHVQYLHNIGVGATLTISLMHEGDLWGLIACHHYSYKYLDSSTRIAAQLQGHFITSQIKVRQVAEQHVMTLQLQSALEKMIEQPFSRSGSSLTALVERPELLALCKAAGVAVMIDNKLYTHGHVPGEPDIHALIESLRLITVKGVVHSSKLADIYPPAESLRDTAAGILFHLLEEGVNIAIIWFRPETIEEVKWAGDPQKAIIKNEFGLSPRKSFALWKEEIKYQSSEWQEPELAAAQSFAHHFERQAHLFSLMEEENKYRLLSEKLKETNSELENINWISTHDLKEPMRKIQLFATRILDTRNHEVPADILEWIRKINAASARMQRLITDILEYSKLRQLDAALTPVDLTALVHSVILELSEDVRELQAEIMVHPLPVVSGNAMLLNQLFVNLIQNSLKYAKHNVPPRVTFNFVREVKDPVPVAQGLFYEIVIRDNGIGFSEKFNESIFNVFTRLHAQGQYSGSGVGLALCRKVMSTHRGFIVAHGNEFEGAEFVLYFPVGNEESRK